MRGISIAIVAVVCLLFFQVVPPGNIQTKIQTKTSIGPPLNLSSRVSTFTGTKSPVQSEMGDDDDARDDLRVLVRDEAARVAARALCIRRKFASWAA